MPAVSFTLDGLPGVTFTARPLSDPPSEGSLVFLLGGNGLMAIAWYRGGAFEIVDRRLPDDPTHWVVPQ